jgi:putative transposase
MDLLFRHGGLRGPEIGALFGVGYSAVSQERKRLRERREKDRKLEKLVRRLEDKLSTMKI